MKRAFYSLTFTLTFAVAFLVSGCGTSSTTVTGPSLERCTVAVGTSMSSVGAAGGNGRLTVTAGRECTWSVTSSASWLTPRQPAGGQGDGNVEFVAAANPNAEPRRGTLVVNGQIVEVVQEGVTCQFELKPASQSVGAEGGNGTFAVEAPDGCNWTPSASAEWITITNTGSRSGNGSVSFTVAANTGAPREGTISAGSRTFTIEQSAPSCRYQLSANTASFGGAGGSGTVNVTAARACTWTASTNVPWMSIVGDASGSGNGVISFTVQANSGAARNGILTIGGQRFTVTQLQAECNYSINPANQVYTAAGGPGSVTVSTTSICTWRTSDVPSWVLGIAATGTGTQTLTFTVDANQGSAREAAIIIAGQTLTVTQAAGCRYSFAPTGHSAAAGGGDSSFAVNTAAGCAWTSSGVPSWITGVPASGTGTQTINFSVAANSGSARSANIVIGGSTFSVTQAAVACNYSLSPASHSATAGGGASAFVVHTAGSCDWTTGGVPAWITGVPASGTGMTTINFTVAANPDPAPRNANITVGGQTFAVTQSAAACSYSLSPASHNATAAGGASTLDVNTTAGCDWTTSGVPGWITGVPASGSGGMTINFTVAANSDPSSRSANITIAGRTFSVTQAAAAAACSYSLNPNSHNATAAGGSSALDVNTMAGCDWTTSGVPGWITGIPASGTGTTTINFTVAANSDPSSRSANITIAGRTFSVTQAAAAAACNYSLNPNSHNATAAGGASSFNVNTTPGCDWTTSGVPGWITGMPGSGSGPTTINFTVAANSDPSSRNANITIGGQTFAVTQAAAAVTCSYSLNPNSHKATAAGGASTFDVNTTAACNWTSSGVPAWITGVPSSGTGQTTINFTVAANTGPARSANIGIEGRTFAVSQASGCTYGVAPAQLTFNAAGAPAKEITLTTDPACEWTATANRPWITIVSGSSGTGSGTIRVALLVNADLDDRQGAVTVQGQTVTITQTFP